MSPLKTVFLDIDNTLYSASTKVSAAMGQKIHEYFVGMGLDHDEASTLHHQYYTSYGLALRGLIRHHSVDPLDFDAKCDQALPLEDLIKPTPHLRKLLEDMNREKVRIWALTNAYRFHAQRVLKILQVDDLLDGVIFCDYEEPNFACKPDAEYYHRALVKAQVSDPSDCYFVDDSGINVKAARALGWGHVVHFCERGLVHVEGGKAKEIAQTESLEGIDVIEDLEELRKVWPEKRSMISCDRCVLPFTAMDYKPQYQQPFSLAEVRLLDVQTIAEEISRLQNSLQRLHETQTLLKEALISEPDPELSKALEENETVIGSQTERISILKLALTEKGIATSGHYDEVVHKSEDTPAVQRIVAPQPVPDEDGVDL
ncbi:Pyrimidine 5-nucleotidase [Mycena indigotica]|uniref:Pyrimidine 5-nucleotidase n=1 Tax=Mycena indigotica TaxID=2126181 RepID=A0A8H6SMU4_9AGAR|nr:Pyrimidine 5-nucleotidase [Mycena indigotica]KAF7301755.1 Pyrimidine 5-nucleotidase [Mycena indigotica]